MKNSIVVILSVCLFFFILPSSVSAASITLTSTKTQLQSIDEEYEVNVNLSINISDNTKYYLRGVFYIPNTTNYCGYTWNGTSWFSGPYSSNDGWKNFLPIVITNNAWTGTLKVKLDTNDSGCQATGTYKFKVQRFTENSSSGTFDSQNEQTIDVIIPTPTLTPTPSPSPSSTPTPTKTPTPTPTPKPQATEKPNTPTPTKSGSTSVLGSTTASNVSPTLTSTQFRLTSNKNSKKDILDGASTTRSVSQTSEKVEVTKTQVLAETSEKPKNNTLALFSIIGGGASLIACGILLYRKYKSTNGFTPI